ncbi:MAG: GHKL domain-containing protein [Eubacteriales bacterium]
MDLFNHVFNLTTPLYCFSIHLFLSSDAKKTKPVIWYIFTYTFYYILLIFLHSLEIAPILSLIINLFFTFVISKLYHYSIGKQILSAVLTTSILMVSEAVFAILTGFMEFDFHKFTVFRSEIEVVLVRLLTFLSAFLYWSYNKIRNQDFLLPQKFYLMHTTVLLGVLILYIRSLGHWKITTVYFLSNTLVLFFVILLVLYTNEKLYYNVVVQAKHKILEQENLALLNQQELVEQSLLTISAVRHDMKNQLLTLSYLQKNNKEEEVRILTEKLILDIENSQPLAKSNHFLIDSILNYKLAQAEAENVDITLNLKVPSDLPLLAYDLTVILGNLIDNSITALKKVSMARLLSVSITVNCGTLLIIIENTFEEQLKLCDGKYLSTKPLSSNHGFGLSNVFHVVERLQGVMDIQTEKNKFLVQIMIPLQDSV